MTPTPVAVRAEALGLPVLRPAEAARPGRRGRDRRAATGPRGPRRLRADRPRTDPRDPALGILNVHPSILPRHRGATPIAATIAAGDAEAGVSIIEMDAGLDTGPIVAVERWPLRGDEDAPSLEAEARLAGGAHDPVHPSGLACRAAPGEPQPAAGATLSRSLRREDGRLDPRRPAIELERRVRALRPWPGTFVSTAAGRLGVLEAAIGGSEPGDVAGTFVADGDGLAIATGEGRLRLLRGPAGGRRGDVRRGAPAGSRPAAHRDAGRTGPRARRGRIAA